MRTSEGRVADAYALVSPPGGQGVMEIRAQTILECAASFLGEFNLPPRNPLAQAVAPH